VSALLYSIIQVVPDPIRDERINVGVILWDDASGLVKVEVRPRARELKALAPRLDTRFLTELREQLATRLAHWPADRSISPSDRSHKALTLDDLGRESANVVQFTRPGVSSRPRDELLRHLMHRFVERQAAARHPRTFRDKGMLKRRITSQFRLVGLAEKLEKNVEVPGERARCGFDYGLRMNGVEFSLVVQALSLEARERDALDQARRELHAFWFDAGQIRAQLPVTLVAYMRGDDHELEREAQTIVDELQVELVGAEAVPEWVGRVAAP
jgi:hypothetical protein